LPISRIVDQSDHQAAFTEDGLSTEFHVSHVAAILSISLYVLGLGFGPLLVGPLSELYGRNIVYRVSYGLFFVFSWPVAFAPNACEFGPRSSLMPHETISFSAVYFIFRFVTGFCGSAFLSVAGGSVSDLFSNDTVAK
jgi:MFS family permease